MDIESVVQSHTMKNIAKGATPASFPVPPLILKSDFIFL